MKKYSRILIIANLILLLGYFNWSVYQKEQTLKDGQLVLLQLAPVDPRSLMQGDYMRLNYKEASSDLIDKQTDTRGYAILRTDSNQIGEIVRLQNTLEPVNGNELVIKYKIINRRLFLGAESFFFEEGQDTLYQKAVYGGLKVDDKGQSLLVGLYDEDFRQIQPDK
ncbi:GDYXXLXY domain-containing protein [Bacteroides sp. 1001136B_160425_E2]|uniref:GDYXXLXY domain-containing protein n=1 Tax=Bacteroides sp. 1001136B_160425_E2 TaxID=2787083 RepID=UPI0018A05F8A|nr:GDYXXLXY domain-containing protein [Bacteroides sp. 1001136B_160425_E2]